MRVFVRDQTHIHGMCIYVYVCASSELCVCELVMCMCICACMLVFICLGVLVLGNCVCYVADVDCMKNFLFCDKDEGRWRGGRSRLS